MIDIKPSIVLEDSKSIKYFFYYKDSSIYYRQISSAGDAKDTILISQANNDFNAAIDTDDTIYVICNSRYKGVLLFIYTNFGWKFEQVVSLHNSSNIYIMDMLVHNGAIHVFFSKKLPIANMYNVYHIYKNINEQIPYIEYSWRKNSLSEIYSQNIENSFSILSSKGGIIHYASVWYDGSRYYINYSCYDEAIKSWIQKNLNITYKNQAFIKLLYHNKRINLLCFSNENEASNIHHFTSRASGPGEIDFKELNNLYIDTSGALPLFHADDKLLQLSWIKENFFHQYIYDDSSAKWKKAIDLPLSADINILLARIQKNSGSISITKGFYILDSNYNLSKPIEYKHKNDLEDRVYEKPKEAYTDTQDYLKQILEEVKGLSENVNYLNKRMDSLEGKTFVQKAQYSTTSDIIPSRSKTASDEALERPMLKKSNFKEKFLKSGKTPTYDSMILNHDSITTYVGKPSSNKPHGEATQEPGSNPDLEEKSSRAFVTPSPPSEKGIAASNKNSSFIKKIGEFFK